MKKNKNKIKIKLNKRGSVLVFTLFLLSISLILGLSLMASSVAGRRSSLSTSKSVHSFQVADSGLEYAFLKIREESFSGSPTAAIKTKNIEDVFGAAVCDPSGFIEYDAGGGGQVSLYFYSDADNDDAYDQEYCYDSSATFDKIEKIKSIGTNNGISRSVEAGGLDFTAY
ncbi:MAG: hypothetical protein RBR98_03050 [Candidatus Moranbacteria bacterium]|jgi:hypothetical protein|nr:hypothetical protein [Candidatus Moranbacteria bacterium]